jgi:hypothetical protein
MAPPKCNQYSHTVYSIKTDFLHWPKYLNLSKYVLHYSGEEIMETTYTYWEADDGWFVGYLNDYPEHLTQGKDLAELEEMLIDIYVIRQEEEKRLTEKRKAGVLRLPA